MEEQISPITHLVNHYLGPLALAILQALHIPSENPELPIPEPVIMGDAGAASRGHPCADSEAAPFRGEAWSDAAGRGAPDHQFHEAGGTRHPG